jgi:hypothetical protein
MASKLLSNSSILWGSLRWWLILSSLMPLKDAAADMCLEFSEALTRKFSGAAYASFMRFLLAYSSCALYSMDAALGARLGCECLAISSNASSP